MTELQQNASSVAAEAKIRSYLGWTTGSGLEKFYKKDASEKLRLRREAFETANKPFLIQWLSDIRLYVYPKDESTRVIFLTGYYEPNEFKIFNEILKPGMFFLDAGANMGLYSLFASKKVGKTGLVIAIEPSKREFDRLESNVEANRMKNVRMIHAALSNSKGEADLLVASDDHAGHNTLGNFAYEGIILKQKERTKVKTIDEISSDLKLSKLDVIKMDIEGSEYHALLGAENTLKRFKPFLMIELFDESLKKQGSDGNMILQFLASLGYFIYEFDEYGKISKFKKVNDSLSQNIFAVHSSSKIKLS